MAEIRTKRIYEQSDTSDGVRILVDRLWPRGIKKEVEARSLPTCTSNWKARNSSLAK